MLAIVDEYTRERLAIDVERGLGSEQVPEAKVLRSPIFPLRTANGVA